MSLITTIAGIPLFTTIQEALTWANANGLVGYHTHNIQNQTGYMGGTSHIQATGMPTNSNAPTTPASPVRNYNSGGGNGSGGGGGGY